MACGQLASSYYLNQCWPIINKITSIPLQCILWKMSILIIAVNHKNVFEMYIMKVNVSFLNGKWFMWCNHLFSFISRWVPSQSVAVSKELTHWPMGDLKEIIWLKYLSWNCHQMNFIGPYWWWVIIGSDNGLVLSGQKSAILTQISVTTYDYQATMS